MSALAQIARLAKKFLDDVAQVPNPPPGSPQPRLDRATIETSSDHSRVQDLHLSIPSVNFFKLPPESQLPEHVTRSLIPILDRYIERLRAGHTRHMQRAALRLMALSPHESSMSVNQDTTEIIRSLFQQSLERHAIQLRENLLGFVRSADISKAPDAFSGSTRELLMRLFEHYNSLNKSEKQWLGARTGLTSRQVATWFANHRQRSGYQYSDTIQTRDASPKKVQPSQRFSPYTVPDATTRQVVQRRRHVKRTHSRWTEALFQNQELCMLLSA